MLDKIRKEAEILAEKQSWIRKGFQNLFDKMNEQVQNVEGDFVVYGRLCESSQINEYQVTIYELCFNGQNDAEFYLVSREKWIHNEAEIECKNIDDCATSIIRKCILCIPGALGEILSKLRKLNGEYQEAIEKLNEMADKLSD